jgi:hypothetical protein
VTYLFKHNNPLALILLAAIAGIPIFHHGPLATFSAPSSNSFVFDKLLDLFSWMHPNKGFVSQLLASILIFTEALYLNKVISDHKLMEKPGYLPALSFLLLNGLIPDALMPSTILVNAILIITFKLMVVSYKQNRSFNILIFIGFLSGFIASLNTSYLLLYLWATIAILIMRPLSLREWLVLTAGFILPFYFLFAGLYLADKLSFYSIFPSLSIKFILPDLTIFSWISISCLVLLPVIGLFKAGDKLGKMVLQVRKSYLISMVLWLNCVLILLLHINSFHQQAGLLLVPSAIMFAPFFGSFKREYFPNLIIVLLIAAALIG